MAAPKVTPAIVESCNLGKLGADGVALQMNFTFRGKKQAAVFGLSREVAQGLVKALTQLLEETRAPAARH